ncbi:MAG TPA: branched-chain amino acid transaminase, partial [Anaeromyxobacteraceae bacterium]|nr:branched-chain amino acid transaminase [Anaeromyxobacteraceae bacterium]
MNKAEKVWLDGKLLNYDDATVHVLTHSLHYGVSVFEGIRAYRTADGRSAVFRLREHLRRLFDSGRIVLMEIPHPLERLAEACIETLRANKQAEAYLRPIAFFGQGHMGVGAINAVQVSIATWPWGAYLSDEGLKTGIRAKVSSFTRTHVNVNMVRAKISGQYVNSFLANREATLSGYDEAILLDTEGYVAEGSGENIFLVRDGTMFTPPLCSPILPGITRDSVLRIA